MSSYSPLDNIETVKNLITALELERSDLESQMDYDRATSVCSDCPHRWDADDLEYISDRCCKEDDDYQAAEHEHIKRIEKALRALRVYLRVGQS